MGDTQWLMYPVGDRGKEDLCHVRSGGCSVTHVPSGGRERKGGSLPCLGDAQKIPAMYAVTLSDVPNGGGEEDLCHVRSGGRFFSAMYAVGDAHQCTSEKRKGGSLPCTQWGTSVDTCTQWGMGEERRISAMYAVGDAQWLMYPVGDVPSSVTPGKWERREGSLPCTQWGTLSDTCTQWGMGEERRISAMYAVGDAQ